MKQTKPCVRGGRIERTYMFSFGIFDTLVSNTNCLDKYGSIDSYMIFRGEQMLLHNANIHAQEQDNKRISFPRRSFSFNVSSSKNGVAQEIYYVRFVCLRELRSNITRAGRLSHGEKRRYFTTSLIITSMQDLGLGSYPARASQVQQPRYWRDQRLPQLPGDDSLHLWRLPRVGVVRDVSTIQPSPCRLCRLFVGFIYREKKGEDWHYGNGRII